MQTLQYSYRGLGLLMRLNWDRAMSSFVIFLALIAGAWMAVTVLDHHKDVCSNKIQACSPFSSF
ncbi:hypothetical protein EBB79_10970 [Parasedimentitalea marina]|uniref:Uncharacterized protein n=1 Tax=Parasedimentitalea marina TaxID=2483033 RepID=A0A3T0N2Y5_9RHOB|nr:hypothetical protein EBB79_10970 [Parasedimentitalea marina]